MTSRRVEASAAASPAAEAVGAVGQDGIPLAAPTGRHELVPLRDRKRVDAAARLLSLGFDRHQTEALLASGYGVVGAVRVDRLIGGER